MLIILILLGIGVLLAAGVYVWRRLNEHRCLAQHHTQLLSSRGGAEGDQRDRLAYPRSGASWHAGPAPQGPPGGGYYYRRLKTSVDESAAATAAVQITVARIRIDDRSRSAPAGRGGRQQPGGAQFSHASAWPGGRAPIVIERRAEFVHPKPGETVGQLIRRCETRLREEEVGAASTFVGDKVSESVWNYVARGWITVREPFDQVVAASRQLEAGIHELLLGRPVELAGRVCGLSSPETRVAGALTSAAPIDLVDRSLGLGRSIIQIGAVVIGAMTHNPQMVGAGLKALAHNELAAACRQGIAEALEDRGRQREERGRIQGPSQRGERGRSREPWQRGSAGRPSRAGRRSAARRPDTSMGDRARPEDRDRGRRADGTSSGRPSAARPPPERRDRRSPTSWGSEGRDPGVQSQRRRRDDDDGRENRGGGRGR